VPEPAPLLLADIGGTRSRCALLRHGQLLHRQQLRNCEHASLAGLLATYLAGAGLSSAPRAALLAVAAPLPAVPDPDAGIRMTNIGWQFTPAMLAAALGLRQVTLLNDFAAQAWALPALAPGQLHPVGGGTGVAGAPQVVLGPGTGLGTAGLVDLDGRLAVVAAEGGHVTLPACDTAEARLVAQVRERFGHCSAERLVSGPGLTLLHELLHGEPGSDAATIGAAADAGDPRAAASLEQMFRFLGTVAADLALAFGARGGVYLAGGILPQHLERFTRSGFRERFMAKGRYRDYLSAIPTQVITAPTPGLLGLAEYARRNALAR
jgi:glucokinase